jgi:hypothetical protein
MDDFAFTTATVSFVRGSGAPICTHFSRCSMSAAASFFFGGMVKLGSLWRTA